MIYQLFFWGVPIITLAGYLFLLLFFVVAKKDKDIRAFIPFLLTLAFWTASSLFMKLQLNPGVGFWNKAMVLGMFLAPLFFYWFLSVFTNNVKWVPMVLWTAISATTIYFNVKGWVVTDTKMVMVTVMENGVEMQRPEFVYTLGPAAIAVYVALFVFIISFLYKSIWAARSGYINFGSIKPIIIGNFIIFFGILSNILPEIGKYPLDLLSGFIYVILIMVSIYKHRFLEFRFMLTRGVVFSLCFLVLTSSYLFAMIQVQRYFAQNYGDNATLLTSLTALLMAIAYQQILSMIYRYVDRMNYKSEYAQRHALKNFSVNMLNNLNLNEITTELLEAVENAIHTTHSSMMIWNEEKQCFTVLKTTVQLRSWDITFTNDHPVIKWFNSNSNNECLSREMMSTLPFFKSMWESERRAISDLNIEVIVPIKSRTGLAGIMLLSQKENNVPYTLSDFDLLSSLGATCGVAIDNAVLFGRAQAQAMTDPLTKLYNHRYFYTELAKQMSSVKDSPLSVVILDVDMFKLYNDLHGHVEGDKALLKVANIMIQCVGDRGTPCRYGGDEFAIILPFYDSRKANDMAERIRTLVQKTFLESEDTIQRFLTVSIGVCTYPYTASSTDKLISCADMALYHAKNSGKNQTVIYTPDLYTQEEETVETFSSKKNPFFAASIYALTAAIDFKDHYTFGHSQNVAEVSTALATEIGLDKVQVDIIKEAALLHDVGKIGIPEHIISKQSSLTSDEYDIVKKHVEISIEIVKHLPLSNQVIPAIIGHHERWDGRGYPRGISGEQIDIGARCLAVADAFDSMISGRPYKKSMQIGDVLTEIEGNMGTQFDPLIARTLISLVREGKIATYNKFNSPKLI